MAALALGKIGEEATGDVVKRLDDADAEVRFYAVWTIGLIGPPAGKELDKILSMLADKNAGVRRKTLYTLGQLKTGGAKVIQALAQALADDNDDVRTEARDARGVGALLLGSLAPTALRLPARAAGWLAGGMFASEDPSDSVAVLRAEDAFDAEPDLGHITAPTIVLGGTRAAREQREHEHARRQARRCARPDAANSEPAPHGHSPVRCSRPSITQGSRPSIRRL